MYQHFSFQPGKKKNIYIYSSVLVIITCAEEGKNDSSGLRVAERWHIALDRKGCFVFKSWPGALSCKRIFCLAFRYLRKCLPSLWSLWVQFSHSVPVASHTVAIQSPQSYLKTNADDCFNFFENIVLWADDMVKEPHIEWFSVIHVWPSEYLSTNYGNKQGRGLIYSIYRAVSGQVCLVCLVCLLQSPCLVIVTLLCSLLSVFFHSQTFVMSLNKQTSVCYTKKTVAEQNCFWDLTGSWICLPVVLSSHFRLRWLIVCKNDIRCRLSSLVLADRLKEED